MTESIRCPICGMVSHNPHDVETRYCGNCHRFHSEMSEIGRELKVSELTRGQVVILEKPGRPRASVRVVHVYPFAVYFRAQLKDQVIHFFARRDGPENERIADDDSPMTIYEYLGKI